MLQPKTESSDCLKECKDGITLMPDSLMILKISRMKSNSNVIEIFYKSLQKLRLLKNREKLQNMPNRKVLIENQ